ncbi:MAG: calcium/sodium antiporter [Rhodothermales bacterium]|nr:calcium/sodium antiporter [Rhodothermales bacterium]MBO6781222.1 calcium/sodium antiporter [Rhodothermales bacterium]
MLYLILLFILGLGALYLGADWLVRGASAIALRLGIRPMVIGLTIVAVGTSMPELLLNVVAVLDGQDALAIGNIVGSNIANIALILGITALLLPLTVEPEALKKEYPMMLGITLLFWFLASNGRIGRIDGIILVACLFAFMAYILIANRRSSAPPVDLPLEEEKEGAVGDTLIARLRSSTWGRVAYVVFGMVMLAIGADLLVDSAVGMADILGIHPGVIGLTALAVGTSLPELAASLVSALRGESDLSVGNVLGSNMLNIMFVVGLVALIQPMTIDPDALRLHFPIMVGFTLLLFPLAWTHQRINRYEGGLLLSGFVAYFAYLLVPYF